MEVPSDLVLVGHVIDAWRLDGSLKVAPYSSDASALLAAKEWWVDSHGSVRPYDVMSARTHANVVAARLVGISDRTLAETLKGARISVSRRRFPITDEGEFYWVDLIGLAVVDEAGQAFGTLVDLMDNGAHQTLVVREEVAVDASSGNVQRPVERLIPFVDAYVKTVDLAGRRVTVDWQKDD